MPGGLTGLTGLTGLGGVAGGGGPAFDLTNLVAYWKLSDLADEVGVTALTNLTAVTFGAGKLGNCAIFNGSHLLTALDNANVSMGANQAFYIDMWLWYDSTATGANRGLLTKGTGGSVGSYEYTMRVNTSDQLVVEVGAAASDKTFGPGFSALTLDAWHYLAMWHDPVADIIGARQDANENTAAWAGGCFDSSLGLVIGGRGGISNLIGKIDDVSIWKRVLTLDERNARYAGGLGIEID